MRKPKARLDFIQLSVAAKIAFYRNVILKLTGNTLFPNPDVTLVDAAKAVDALETAYLTAKDGGHTAVALMRDTEEATDKLFRNIVAYVDRIADGSDSAILSSGFNVSKQPASSQKPELAVQDGDNSGSVWLVARAVDKAGAYIWQYVKDKMPETEAEWMNAGHSTQSYIQIAGLTVATKYYFRVSAITKTGNTDFTAPVMKVIV